MSAPTADGPIRPDGDDDASLLGWLQAVADENVPDTFKPAAVTVAWMGRTSTDDAQDPTLSLPRQLENSRGALPPGFVIVAKFYDVESGRNSVERRGTGNAHQQFDIPLPRDRGIALLAADEGIDPAAVPGLNEGAAPFRRATPTLTRRIKQAIAEWYVLNMLELSWGGTKAHTDQGFNIGKPPYGYTAARRRHPVKVKAEQGKVKHRLAPDPVRGPVVTQIFLWRAFERLGYQAIADRLDLDADRYPPPEPILGQGRRRVGCWTFSNVREILDNPSTPATWCGTGASAPGPSGASAAGLTRPAPGCGPPCPPTNPSSPGRSSRPPAPWAGSVGGPVRAPLDTPRPAGPICCGPTYGVICAGGGPGGTR
jgi:hypothetical protein